MDEDASHTERIGYEARMLTTRAAKTRERVFRHVVAALHGDLLDRVRHVLDSDLQEPFRNFFWRSRDAGRGLYRRGYFHKLALHDIGIERQGAARAGYAREPAGADLSGPNVAVPHGQWNTR